MYILVKCLNKPRSDGISKLSFVENSNIEWNTLQNVKNLLAKIPGYTNYFLLSNISTCVPDKLTSKDKENFSKCISLEESDYNTNNINNNLSKFKIINMPHGGINLSIKLFGTNLNILGIKNVLKNSSWP